MDYSGIITAVGGIVGALSSPKAPSIESYKPTPIEQRSLSDYLPEVDSLMSSQADMALSMMDGEIPASVVDQIKMYAGESAQRGGYGSSSNRVGNVVARDLGLSALDLMERGQGYSNFLVNQARGSMNDAVSIDVANANMAYDAWASNAQIQMDSWKGDANRRANLVSSLTSAGSQLATARYMDKQQAKDASQYNELLASLKAKKPRAK